MLGLYWDNGKQNGNYRDYRVLSAASSFNGSGVDKATVFTRVTAIASSAGKSLACYCKKCCKLEDWKARRNGAIHQFAKLRVLQYLSVPASVLLALRLASNTASRHCLDSSIPYETHAHATKVLVRVDVPNDLARTAWRNILQSLPQHPTHLLTPFETTSSSQGGVRLLPDRMQHHQGNLQKQVSGLPGPRWHGSKVLKIVAPEKSETPLAFSTQCCNGSCCQSHSCSSKHWCKHEPSQMYARRFTCTSVSELWAP